MVYIPRGNGVQITINKSTSSGNAVKNVRLEGSDKYTINVNKDFEANPTGIARLRGKMKYDREKYLFSAEDVRNAWDKLSSDEKKEGKIEMIIPKRVYDENSR